MEWYSLEDLQQIAIDRHKCICAWRPTNMADLANMYVWDKSAKPEEFKDSPFEHSIKLVIEPNGKATIFTFNKQGGYSINLIDAPLQSPIPNPSNDTFELIINGDRRKNPEKGIFRSMTFEEIKALTYNDHPWTKLNNNKAGQCKVNGKIRTWVRDTERIEVPCKYGMYECYTFTRRDIDRLLIRIS